MSGSNRQLYLTATVLDQAFLDQTVQDNLVTALELIVDVDATTGTIRASDRNKYVGSSFYESRCIFPVIKREITHWLDDQVSFSSLTIELNNADGRFNNLELGGADYSGFVGKSLTVKLGLRDVASTYQTIFKGFVTQVGGAGRTVKSLVLTARDRFQAITNDFPTTVLTTDVYPFLEQDKIGKAVPVIYGDWSTDTATLFMLTASITVICTNGTDAILNPTHNAKFIISDNANLSFDPANVYIFRDNLMHAFDPGDVVNVSGGKNSFELIQNGITVILPPPGTAGAGVQWAYSNGDQIYCRVIGKDMGAHDSWNAVAQARDLLETYGDLVGGDFDANWATYEAKASPAQSAIASIKSRIWVQTPQPLVSYAQSLLVQVRLRFFISQSDQLRINSLHFEDFVASPAFEIKNWDVCLGSFKPSIDERNNFNRVQGLFDRDPATNDTKRATGWYNAAAAIAQSGTVPLSKQISFPNLYVASDVNNQVIEILRLACGFPELIDVELTSRAVLQELGEWVKISVKIGSTQFDNVPAMLLAIGYDPAGLKLPCQLWSMQAVRFPGWTPPGAGITGGFDITITAE